MKFCTGCPVCWTIFGATTGFMIATAPFWLTAAYVGSCYLIRQIIIRHS